MNISTGKKTPPPDDQGQRAVSAPAKKVKPTTNVSPNEFKILGAEIMNRPGAAATNQFWFNRRWKSNFLIDPAVLSEAWKQLELHEHDDDRIRQGCKPVHLLWAAQFLKVNLTESVMAQMCECHEDTFRKSANGHG